MELTLNAHEARVLGVLIEKAFATPDQYPLTLNAISNGCNQKSNRDPVVHFSEAEIHIAIQGLQMKHLMGGTVPSGSRVEKYHHNAVEHFGLGEKALAVLTELLLRGPQAAGELRTRASRMRTLDSLETLDKILAKLKDKGYIKRIPPKPGSRAERHAQTICPGLHPDGEEVVVRTIPHAPAEAGPQQAPVGARSVAGRLEALETEVSSLRRQLNDLAEKLGEPLEG